MRSGHAVAAGNAHHAVLHGIEHARAVMRANGCADARVVQQPVRVDQPLVPGQIMRDLRDVLGDDVQVQAHGALDLFDALLCVAPARRGAGHGPLHHLLGLLHSFLLGSDAVAVAVVLERVIAAAHGDLRAVRSGRGVGQCLDLFRLDAGQALFFGRNVGPKGVQVFMHAVDELQLLNAERLQDGGHLRFAPPIAALIHAL